MRLLVLLSLILLISACKTTKDVVVSEEDIKQVKVNPEDMVFSMQKGACFGTCPEYKLTIYKDRFAQFMGKRNTDRIGTYGKFLTKEEYTVVANTFEKEDFFSYQDIYESEIADLPLMKIAQQKGGEMKLIAGKRERPEALHRIQFRLEQIAENKNGWTFINDTTGEKAEIKINKNEIVLDIAKGNQLARWFNQVKEDYGVQILKKLSNNSDSWLITYDTKNHDADTFLKYLQADPVIKSASFKVEKLP